MELSERDKIFIIISIVKSNPNFSEGPDKLRGFLINQIRKQVTPSIPPEDLQDYVDAMNSFYHEILETMKKRMTEIV